METETAAVGDNDGFVVKRVLRFSDAAVRLAGSSIDFGRALHGQRFMRAFVVKFFDEGVELRLLLQQIRASRGGSLPA